MSLKGIILGPSVLRSSELQLLRNMKHVWNKESALSRFSLHKVSELGLSSSPAAAVSFLVVAGAFVCLSPLISFRSSCYFRRLSLCLRLWVERSRVLLGSDPAVPVTDLARAWWFRRGLRTVSASAVSQFSSVEGSLSEGFSLSLAVFLRDVVARESLSNPLWFFYGVAFGCAVGLIGADWSMWVCQSLASLFLFGLPVVSGRSAWSVSFGGSSSHLGFSSSGGVYWNGLLRLCRLVGSHLLDGWLRDGVWVRRLRTGFSWVFGLLGSLMVLSPEAVVPNQSRYSIRVLGVVVGVGAEAVGAVCFKV
ncbi:unnamed protein product [Brassica rapa subsp. trilocularis]